MISNETKLLLQALKLKPGNLINKTALITGGAMGIGEKLCQILSFLGAKVILVDKDDRGNMVTSEIIKKEYKAHFIKCDLSDLEDLEKMALKVKSEFGQIDVLVNNAVKSNISPAVSLEIDDWNKIIDTNLRAGFLTTKHFLPGMLEKKSGTIVNVIAFEGSPLSAAYSATKVGLRSLALSVSREIGADSGVSVYSFLPGTVDTPLLRVQLIPAVSKFLNLDDETIIKTMLSNNPGYEGLMPAEHCAAALAFTIFNSKEYHGQVADPFEPLERHGVIDVKENSSSVSEAVGLTATIPLHLKDYISSVNNTNKELEGRIRVRTEELYYANQILLKQRQEILDSITYAKRIQNSILPSRNIIHKYLPNSFVFYCPKDIVAGDFYWIEKVKDLIIFAACDCTGHGVPGALVSVICHNALNQAVKELGLIQPAAILDKTTELVIESFSKSEEDINDGMDISLCTLDVKTNTIQWAGANNPLWLLQNGILSETKADKQPIGLSEIRKPYSNHTFNLNKGDCIYLFTDGYADQFGGENGQKKLTRKKFKELLESINDRTMDEQCQELNDFINHYRKDVEQIDDILVFGVRV